MSATYAIGVIDDALENGGRFSILPQNGREMPQEGDHITVWNQDGPGSPLARLRGEITEITGAQGTFITTEQEVDPGWPGHLRPFGRGNPVYLAHRDSFMPDMSRQASPEEYALMVELAKDHERAAGIRPAAAAAVIAVAQEGDGIQPLQDMPELRHPYEEEWNGEEEDDDGPEYGDL